MLTKTRISNEAFEKMASRLGPCELIDGKIIPMAPASGDHGEIEVRIGAIIFNFVDERQLGRVYGGETGMHVRSGRCRGADVAYASFKRIPHGTKKFLRVPPELIVEVKSDDMSWMDIRKKVRDYHIFGVDVVWVADAETRTVRVYPKGAKSFIIPSSGEIDGGEILPGFRVKIARFFGPSQ